jgi:hypothetical protein
MAKSYGMRGWQLQVGHPTTVFVAISQLKEISGPSAAQGSRDVTHLESAAKEFAPTLPDNGTLSGSCIYNPSDPGQVSLITLVSTPTTLVSQNQLSPFKLISATTTQFFIINGLVMKADIVGGDVEATAMLDFEVKISGAVTYPTT